MPGQRDCRDTRAFRSAGGRHIALFEVRSRKLRGREVLKRMRRAHRTCFLRDNRNDTREMIWVGRSPKAIGTAYNASCGANEPFPRSRSAGMYGYNIKTTTTSRPSDCASSCLGSSSDNRPTESVDNLNVGKDRRPAPRNHSPVRFHCRPYAAEGKRHRVLPFSLPLQP